MVATAKPKASAKSSAKVTGVPTSPDIEKTRGRRLDITPEVAEWFNHKGAWGFPAPSAEMVEIAKSFTEFMSIKSNK